MTLHSVGGIVVGVLCSSLNAQRASQGRSSRPEVSESVSSLAKIPAAFTEGDFRMTRRAYVVVLSAMCLSGSGVAEGQDSGREVFQRNRAAVVTIETGKKFGSGVIIDSAGVVVTNLHVIQEGPRATIRLSNGDAYDDVAVIDYDVRKDLVLLKIKGYKLTAAELGDSDNIRVGDRVFAIGAPEGLELTLSEGVISAVRDSGEGYRVVQTDAAISPGSSGGGLFDVSGRLVGITSFKTRGENLNFAYPINYVRGMLSTQERMTIAELAAKLVPAAPAGAAAAPVEPSRRPGLAAEYRIGNGDRLLVQQDDDSATLTFVNRMGAIYADGRVVWDTKRKGFFGEGTVKVLCGSVDDRVWAAPTRQEFYVVNQYELREHWTQPDRVNCNKGQVLHSSWQEALWLIAGK
jgi:S1-C subfamily serine protease